MKKVLLLLLLVGMSTMSYANELSFFGGLGTGSSLGVESSDSMDLDSSATIGISYTFPVNNFVQVGVYSNYVAEAAVSDSDYTFNTSGTSLSFGLTALFRQSDTQGFYFKTLIGANKTDLDVSEELAYLSSFLGSYYEDYYSLDSADVSLESSTDIGVTVGLGLGYKLNKNFSIEAIYQLSTFDLNLDGTLTLSSEGETQSVNMEPSTTEYEFKTFRIGAVYTL